VHKTWYTGAVLEKTAGGYLLHSGDPKILWLRAARLARQPREGTPSARAGKNRSA